MTKRSATLTGTNKRRKPGLRAAYTTILSKLMEITDEVSGEKTVGPFLKLPPKKIYPDYYTIIEKPISLAEIQKKLKANKYSDNTPDEFLADFKLLLDNAARYNDPNSWIVAQATKLHSFVQNEVDNVHEPITMDSLPDVMESMLDEVINHEFEDGVVSYPFLDDVDTNEYPDYLSFVSDPTSFNTVKDKIARGLFARENVADSLKAFYDATLMIFSNTLLYNGPNTAISQDAKRLENVFKAKYKALLESSARARPKLPKVKLNLKLKRIKTEDDSDGETGPAVILENPQKSDANTMGKSVPALPPADCVIQETAVSSAASLVGPLNTLVGQRIEESYANQLSQPELVKSAMFPTHPQCPSVSSLVDYRMSANGFTSQAYTVVLPPEAPPFVTVRVALHSIIYNRRRHDLLQDDSRLATDEEFQCKLSVNSEDVGSGTCYEDKRPHRDLLGVAYEVKLAQGLNVVDIECKVAPSLSKRIKKERAVQETEEVGGRHTRHQMQQLKMTWDVERVTYYIVAN